MPHNSTSPSYDARQAAAQELRTRAVTLRELAADAERSRARALPIQAAALSQTTLAHSADEAIEWAKARATELDTVATWLDEPFGRCDECGSVLQHFHAENVGGVLCPDCDGEHVAEIEADARRESFPLAQHDPHRNERERAEHKLPAAQSKCPVCNAYGVITAQHLRQLNATCLDCGWHYTDKPACAICKHTGPEHSEDKGRKRCDCCERGTFCLVDPLAGDFAHAIVRGLRKMATAERFAHATTPIAVLKAAAEQTPAAPPRPLCADCGRPMMFDHTVCFSDDCTRARRELAAQPAPLCDCGHELGDHEPRPSSPRPFGCHKCECAAYLEPPQSRSKNRKRAGR